VRFLPLKLTPACFALPGDRLGTLPSQNSGRVNDVVHFVLLSPSVPIEGRTWLIGVTILAKARWAHPAVAQSSERPRS
jgi:hypothetical protein